jgi:FkbM family methyltransferase
VNVKRTIKRLIFGLVSVRAVNVLLRALLRLFLPVLPNSIVRMIPVVGRICVELPNSEVLIVESDGGDSIASALYWNGLRGYEPDTVHLYFQLLRHSTVVFDIGSNTGLFALLAAISDRSREVHAFEPLPEAFRYLAKNVEINALHNLKPVCCAVTNYDGVIPLYIPRSITVSHNASTLKGFREATETILVPAIKLDTYVKTNNIAKVDLIKIDTEGAECKVLEGAKSILKRDEPVIICEVLKGLTEDSLDAIFEGTEYRFFNITGNGLIRRRKIVADETRRNVNYLLITGRKVPEILQGINVK